MLPRTYAIGEYCILKVKTVVIPVDQVFNEFSAGQEDPTAIRTFCQVVMVEILHSNISTLFGMVRMITCSIIQERSPKI